MRKLMYLWIVAAMYLCGCANNSSNNDSKAVSEQFIVSQQDNPDEAITPDEGMESEESTQVNNERKYYWPTTHKYNVGSMEVGEESDHIEILASPREPIYAVCDGVISDMGIEDNWGKYIVLDAGDGITFKYGGVTSHFVYTGDVVKGGDVIALVQTGENISANRFPIGAYNKGVAFDPVSITDNWTYEEFEDLRLMRNSFFTRVMNYDGYKNRAIKVERGDTKYDEQGGVIIVIMKVDNRLYSEDDLQSPEFMQMTDDLKEKLDEYLDDVLINVMEGRIDINRYRTELEIRYEPWLPDRIIEHYL